MTETLDRLAADHAELRRLTDELFITTDLKDWAGARALFADGPVDVDMSSLVGGEPIKVTADQLIAGFQVGLHADKVSHHLATNYRIEVTGDRAEVWAHGYSWTGSPHCLQVRISGRRGALPIELPTSCRPVAS